MDKNKGIEFDYAVIEESIHSINSGILSGKYDNLIQLIMKNPDFKIIKPNRETGEYDNIERLFMPESIYYELFKIDHPEEDINDFKEPSSDQEKVITVLNFKLELFLENLIPQIMYESVVIKDIRNNLASLIEDDDSERSVEELTREPDEIFNVRNLRRMANILNEKLIKIGEVADNLFNELEMIEKETNH